MPDVLPPPGHTPPDHDFGFDATHGYDLDALLQVESPEPPADFEAFWRDTYAAALAVPPRPVLGESVAVDDDRYDVRTIDFNALGDDGTGTRRIGGWLAMPKDRPAAFGLVGSHGYGGRSEPGYLGLFDDRPPAILLPCARGFHRSASPDLPDSADRHVVHGIEAKETYLHRGCVADIWAAVTALLELAPETTGKTGYAGGSFGGGIGGLATPWDDRIKRVWLDIPSFGNHPLRMQLPSGGSAASVRERWRRDPAVLDVLAYFDSATAARFATAPTLVTPAVLDPAVAPAGQFAVFNALPCEKRCVCRDWAHVDWPNADDERRLIDEPRAWLSPLAG